jgi:hypothetical protein
MTMFAKLYGADKGQVLVKLDTGEEGNPEVRVFFEPEQLGVCSCALSWDDDFTASWDKAEKVFAGIDETKARGMVAKMCEQLHVNMPNTPLCGEEGGGNGLE